MAWAAGVTAAEALTRRVVQSRSRAWITAYGILCIVTRLDCRFRASGAVPSRRGQPAGRAHGGGMVTAVGMALTLGGYSLGRRLLGDTPSEPPHDSLLLELAALGVVIPAVEDAIWGGRVEPEIGIAGTAVLFAAKHVAVDGRTRRGLGLAAFWVGLGLLRRRSPRLASGAHHACNSAAVLMGHATGVDQF